MNSLRHILAFFLLSIIFPLSLVIGWTETFKSMDEINTEEPLNEEVLSDELQLDGLTERTLKALRDSPFGLSRVVETETYKNFELYIKSDYDSKLTKQLLSDLTYVFQKDTDKKIRIMLVGTGNTELVYWIYENDKLERIR